MNQEAIQIRTAAVLLQAILCTRLYSYVMHCTHLRLNVDSIPVLLSLREEGLTSCYC
jgi:hypothetical protein